MQLFECTQRVLAKPMNKLEYCLYRGWQVPDDEDELEEGYLIEYLHTGHSNHPDHEGYICWAPKKVFDNTHKHMRAPEPVQIGKAIDAFARGHRITRKAWQKRSPKYLTREDFFADDWLIY